MRAFRKLFEEIDSTTSTNEKVEALKRYFFKTNPEDAMWAVLILTSRMSKRVITSRALREAFVIATDYPDWLFEECYSQVGDTAETISLLLQSLDVALKDESPTEKSLSQWIEFEIPELASIKDLKVRSERLMSYWRNLTPDGIFILNKLMTGGFRVGASEKLVIRALSEVFEISSDQIAHRLSGDVLPGAENFLTIVSKEETKVLGSKPYPFCLAHSWNDRSESNYDPAQWDIEWKYDGIRSQVIHREGKTYVWSRGEEDISKSFPDLLELFVGLPEGTVIDGEVLIIIDGKIEPFQTLQKRLGRKKLSPAFLKEVPAGFIAYDCLEFKGEDIRLKPLRERRAALEEVMQPLLRDRFRLSAKLSAENLEALENLRAQARDNDAEGVMLKDWGSPYSVGRKTGHWWKHKVDPLTLDAVLIYAQAGTGRRANLYTDYTFALWKKENDELVPFAKAYSGLDQSEIDELDRWIRTHTKEKFGPVRSVAPEQVFEIGFEGIAKSSRHKSGIAVRFPRILRWRKDKKAGDANSLGSALELLDVRSSI